MMLEVGALVDATLERITMDAVPQPVSATLDAEASGFEPTFDEKSTRDGGSTIVSEFEGQEVDLEINEDGSGFADRADTAA